MEGLGLLPPPSNDPVRQYKIDHAGQIDKLSFKVVAGVFCGVASVAALVRLVARAMRRRRLYLDDYLVLFAVISLGAATGVLYHYCDSLFLVQAMNTEGVIPTRTEIMPILDIMKWTYIYVALIWSCIFAIKLAFLSFFHPLLSGMPKKLSIYYWSTIIFNICCWIFLVLQPLIPCPHFGLDAVNTCYRNFSHAKSLATSIVAAVLDIVTDAMILSIPIYVLRKTLLKMSQKIGLALFLCTSLAMIVVALVRVIGQLTNTSSDSRGTNPTWGTLFNQIEGAIAVTMSSLLVARAFFLDSRHHVAQRSPWAAISRALYYLLTRLRILKDSSRSESVKTSEDKPRQISTLAMTRSTLRGIKTFFGGSSNMSDRAHVLDSETYSIETSLESANGRYHNIVRECAG